MGSADQAEQPAWRKGCPALFHTGPRTAPARPARGASGCRAEESAQGAPLLPQSVPPVHQIRQAGAGGWHRDTWPRMCRLWTPASEWPVGAQGLPAADPLSRQEAQVFPGLFCPHGRSRAAQAGSDSGTSSCWPGLGNKGRRHPLSLVGPGNTGTSASVVIPWRSQSYCAPCTWQGSAGNRASGPSPP